MIRRLIKFIRSAGAKRERDTERDGFLSYKSETHSVAYGLGLGFATVLGLAGQPELLGIVVAALGGVTAKRRFGDGRVWREIRDEPQYFLPAIVLGGVLALPVIALV